MGVRKTKTLFFFPGEIIKFQLSLPLSGKMNEMNALTPTNTGYRRVAFSLCTKVCGKKAKLSEAVPYLLRKPVVSEKVLCVFVSLLPYY